MSMSSELLWERLWNTGLSMAWALLRPVFRNLSHNNPEDIYSQYWFPFCFGKICTFCETCIAIFQGTENMFLNKKVKKN